MSRWVTRFSALAGVLVTMLACWPGHASASSPSDEQVVDTAVAGFDVVPKTTSLSSGWVYSYANSLPNGNGTTEASRPQGIEVVGDYLWQVGGLNGGWPSWLGFYLGWVIFPEQAANVRTGVLEYGLRVKHALFPGERLRPFLTYGLGTTQVWIDGFDGRDITHQTRLGLGLDTDVGKRLKLTVELAWHAQNLPVLDGQDWSFSSLGLSVGGIYRIDAKNRE